MTSNARKIPAEVLSHPAIVTLVERGAPSGSVTPEEVRRASEDAAIEPRHLKALLGHLSEQGISVNIDVASTRAVAAMMDMIRADLALLAAIVSSFRDRALPQDLVIFGEVGLSGEIRPVPSGQERIYEAAKHGFTRALVPKSNAPRKAIDGMKVIPVTKLSDALTALEEL